MADLETRMREVNALYGGEMSAHHYFRGFAYCDSGMIPWLLIWELLSIFGKSLRTLLEDVRVTCAQLMLLPIERASLPMPLNTSPTPFITPRAVPQALSVRAHASTKKIRFIISAPCFASCLENFAQFAKYLWGPIQKYLSTCFVCAPMLGCYG